MSVALITSSFRIQHHVQLVGEASSVLCNVFYGMDRADVSGLHPHFSWEIRFSTSCGFQLCFLFFLHLLDLINIRVVFLFALCAY